MKIRPGHHAALASVALLSLLVYVLACTSPSFSPDDSQVLFTSFDPQTGAPSIALYDRASGLSETLYVSAPAGKHQFRAQWLPDGEHVLVVCAIDADADMLSLTVLPRTVGEPVRQITLGSPDAAGAVLYPLMSDGSRLFLQDGENQVACVDLSSGKIERPKISDGGSPLLGEIHLFAATGNRIGYFSEVGSETSGGGAEVESPEPYLEIGLIDAVSLELTPLWQQAGTKGKLAGLPAISPDGRTLIVMLEDEGTKWVQVIREGQVILERALITSAEAETVDYGIVSHLSPRADRLITTYRALNSETMEVDYGVVEIPLDDQPVRRTPLFRVATSSDSDLALFQSALSHDGATVAVASTALTDTKVSAADRALYLVDLTSTDRTVTKIAVPIPDETQAGGGN